MEQKKYGIICDVGGKGKGNQDSAFFTSFDLIIAPASLDSTQFSYKGLLGIICDGVSASSHGEKGSTFIIRNLSSKIMNYLYNENLNLANIAKEISNLISKSNMELISKYKDEIEKGKVPKTTIVGFLILGQWAWIFNIGDSPSYVIKDNDIIQTSIDDVGTGASHEITQALGQVPIDTHINVYNWAFENNKSVEKEVFEECYYILICSDGLSDKVSMEEIKYTLIDQSEKKTVQEKIQLLYDVTMKRGIDDNVSIIAVNLAEYFKSLSSIQLIKLSLPN